MVRAVFLDRDGVINRAVVREGRPHAPVSVADVAYIPGVPEAIESFRRAGFRVIVVTNQPDVATGAVQREVVEAIHADMRRLFPIDDIRVCYHVDRDGCRCRKPKPGMLLDAAAEWSIDLRRSYMIGDRWRDIGAGRAAGCKTILIRANYREGCIETPDAVVDSLLEASAVILSNQVSPST